MWNTHGVLTFETGAYKLDFISREVRKLFTPPAGERLLAGGEVYRQPDASGTPGEYVFLAFATSAGIYVHRPDGQLLFSLPLEKGPAEGYRQATVTWAAGRYFIWYQHSSQFFDAMSRPQYVLEVTPGGEVVARHELPPLPPMISPSEPAQATVLGVAMSPVLLGAGSILSWIGGQSVADMSRQPDFRAMFTAMLISATVCAAITFWIARRYAFRRGNLIGWTIGNWLLGPAGVLTMLALRSWPARERCPSCGRLRVVDREHCPACGGEFAQPAVDGTEIFAV